MLKYKMLVKMCSTVMGGCYEVPKKVSYDTHYDCGLAGYSMAHEITKELGKDYVNKNYVIVSFQCHIKRIYDPKPQL